MGNCECGTYHRCHGDNQCTHLRGADIPIRYNETEVYYEKVPLEPDRVTSSTETIYERVRKTRNVVTYKKVLTPRWVPTYDHRGGYTIQDESQVRVETPEEYYEDVPVSRNSSKTTPGRYRTERRERVVTKTRYQPNYIRCICKGCRCGKCILRRSCLNPFSYCS